MEQNAGQQSNQDLQISQDGKRNKFKQALEALGIESYFIILIIGLFLSLNYFNIVPVSKNINALSFLPHQKDINLMLNKTPKIDKVIPSPTPYSHKIADMPTVNNATYPIKYIPIFSPNKEHVIIELLGGQESYQIPDCTLCSNMAIITAGYSYRTNKLSIIGFSPTDKTYHILIDNKELRKTQDIEGIDISRDGEHFASWDWINGYIVYYIDGIEKMKYADPSKKMAITSISFSPDGENGYILLSTKQDQYGKVFVNGVQQPYEGRAFSFAPKGDSFAYVGTSGPSKEFVVLNGQKQNEYTQIGDGTYLGTTDSNNYVWSPDGKRIAYVANAGPFYPQEFAIIVDGKIIATGFFSVKYLLFSPNNLRFAYVASTQSGKIEVVVDGHNLSNESGDIIEAENGIYFSPDSKRFLYNLGGYLYEYLLNSVPSKLNSDKATSIDSVVFSPDSKRLAFTLTKVGIGSLVDVDGNEYKGYDPSLAPIFSPDSKHVAFWQGDIQSAVYMLYLAPQPSVVLDSTQKISLINPYGGLLESYLLASPSRSTTYQYLQPNTFSTEILNTISFTKDSKYMEFNAIRGREYWVIVIDTNTGKEVIDKNTPIPANLPLSNYFLLNTPSSPTPTPTP